MITINKKISYFGFNFNRKSTLVLSKLTQKGRDLSDPISRPFLNMCYFTKPYYLVRCGIPELNKLPNS